jgi:hypothetical protein
LPLPQKEEIFTILIAKMPKSPLKFVLLKTEGKISGTEDMAI